MSAPIQPDKGFPLNSRRRGRVSRFNFILSKMKIKLPALALAALLFAGLPLASISAYVSISVGIAPTAIPVYAQPLCSAPGYIWVPGYWAWGEFGYYWVPGVWVAPPRVGLLWTPGYWGYSGGSYVFHDGYWGPRVGFYGGINYGYGYWGRGYYGGEWVGNSFRYNTAVSRVNTTVIHNTYVNKAALKNNTRSRASFNGPGGANARPSAQEQAAEKAEHLEPTAAQRARVEAAKNDPALHARNNKGKPKAEAVRALDRKVGSTPAAAAAEGSESMAKKQAGTGQRGDAGKAKGKATKAADNSRRAAKGDRTENAATTHARKAEHAKRNAVVRNGPPRVAKPEQATMHRSQAVKPRPAASGRGPAPSPENAKKKKKKGEKEKPGG